MKNCLKTSQGRLGDLLLTQKLPHNQDIWRELVDTQFGSDPMTTPSHRTNDYVNDDDDDNNLIT